MLDRLPREMLEEIFFFLDVSIIGNLAQVNHAFNRLLISDQYWRRLFERFSFVILDSFYRDYPFGLSAPENKGQLSWKEFYKVYDCKLRINIDQKVSFGVTFLLKDELKKMKHWSKF